MKMTWVNGTEETYQDETWESEEANLGFVPGELVYVFL
jgi:hypothetical protein